MKRIKYLLLLCVVTFTLTGCVKFNVNMDIKKDKSMDFSIIYAVNESLLGEEELFSAEDKSKLEEQGFTVNEYSQDGMRGYTLVKKIKNIDEVSSTADAEYDLSGLMNDDVENKYIFKVKKGLLKNVYIANFKFDASESDLSNNTNTETTEDDLNVPLAEDGTDITDTDTTDTDSSSGLDFGTSDMDLSSLTSNMDLSFNVTLPYAAKSNNASRVDNNGKKLSWNMSSTEAEAIKFEFEFYNMTTIYIAIGVAVLLIAAVVVVILVKKKGTNPSNETYQGVTNQPVAQSGMDQSQTMQPENLSQPAAFGTVQQPVVGPMMGPVAPTPMGTPIPEPFSQPVVEPIMTPVQPEPAAQPMIVEPVQQPVVEPTMSVSTETPIYEPVAQPMITEPVMQPEVETVASTPVEPPVSETVAEPVVQQMTTEPVSQPVVEQAVAETPQVDKSQISVNQLLNGQQNSDTQK